MSTQQRIITRALVNLRGLDGPDPASEHLERALEVELYQLALHRLWVLTPGLVWILLSVRHQAGVGIRSSPQLGTTGGGPCHQFHWHPRTRVVTDQSLYCRTCSCELWSRGSEKTVVGREAVCLSQEVFRDTLSLGLLRQFDESTGQKKSSRCGRSLEPWRRTGE